MRSKLPRILAAALGLALAFTFSCSSDDTGGTYSLSSSSDDTPPGTPSSSSGISSSGGTPSSSSGTSSPGGTPSSSSVPLVNGGGDFEKWTTINLNYDVEGSKCYNNNAANCATYGRLYNYAAAMALPQKCNSILSRNDADCAINAPHHRGLCPEGKHIPTKEEWEALVAAAGSSTVIAAKKLMATGTSWSNTGTDDYGFAALSGGYGLSDGTFKGRDNIDGTARWWSASEDNATYAYGRNITRVFGGGTQSALTDDNKNDFSSVRCLNDYAPGGTPGNPSSSSPNVTPSSSSSQVVPSSSSDGDAPIVFGPSVTQGSETYQTVVIGTQTWFKRNLNNSASGTCYEGLTSNCTKYGRLYTWADAKTVCPSGWRLPSNADWDNLLSNYTDGFEGWYMKAPIGWDNYDGLLGADANGFSALPGGFLYDGSYLGIGNLGWWWSSNDSGDSAYSYFISYENDAVTQGAGSKEDYRFSVRCMKDN
jgi:uncharacterized protein (TIGR02145 family)